MYTQPGLDVLKLGRFKCHQNLCIKTGSERQFDIFDGKCRRLSEPYVMTLQLTYMCTTIMKCFTIIDILEVSQILRIFFIKLDFAKLI